jgi:hypothetical protein
MIYLPRFVVLVITWVEFKVLPDIKYMKLDGRGNYTEFTLFSIFWFLGRFL